MKNEKMSLIDTGSNTQSAKYYALKKNSKWVTKEHNRIEEFVAKSLISIQRAIQTDTLNFLLIKVLPEIFKYIKDTEQIAIETAYMSNMSL